MRRTGWLGVLATTFCVAATCLVTTQDRAALAQTSDLRFVNVTRSSGVAFDPTMSWGSNWIDHDSDGDVDLFANRHWKKPRFYSNLGSGIYRLRSETFPQPGIRFFDRHTCGWGEATGDGRLDLYCASGAQSGEGAGPNQLWVQGSDGRFTNQSRTYRTQERRGRTRHISWIDYDSDGDLDIYIANKQRDDFPNLMFRNDRGTFARVDAGLSEEVNSLSSTWSDWDNDGDPDLLLTRYAPEATLAYENEGGQFGPATLPGITGVHWIAAAWGDYDGDGNTDLSLTRDREVAIFRNLGDTFVQTHSEAVTKGASTAWADWDNDGGLDLFVVQARSRGVNHPDFLLTQSMTGFDRVALDSIAGPRAGTGESVAIADHDRDGRLDAFVTNGATLAEESQIDARWMLFENRSEVGEWTALDLVGTEWNPLGFGTRISVSAGSLNYQREINDGLALRAQSEVGHLLLGLGSQTQASVVVTWPDGTVDCVSADAGSTTVVRIGQHPCP